MSTIDPDLLPMTSAALGALPNIKPRNALRLLKDVREDLVMQNMPKPYGQGKPPSRCAVYVLGGNFVGPRVGGIRITPADLEGAFTPDRWEVERLTPEGAALIARLYREGAFELRKKSDVPGEATELDLLAASRTELEAKTAARRAERQAEAEAKQALLADPAQIREEEFTWSLLNSVFAQHVGYGGSAHTLEVGGIPVSKSVRRFESNSGKSGDFEVSFSWTGADGEQHTLVRESHYRDNRRNDPDRNYGLGRE
jgi:hypothetical protein